MRPVMASLALALVATSSVEAAPAAELAPACSFWGWVEAPALLLDERLLYLVAKIDPDLPACLRAGKQKLTVVWEASVAGAWVKVAEEDVGKAPKVDARLFPSAYCDKTPKPAAVRARVEAPAGLSGAAFTSPVIDVTSVCEPCSQGAGSMGVIREEKELQLEGDLGEEWLACVRARRKGEGGKITLRVFLGDDMHEIMKAIRPTMVFPVEPKGGRVLRRLPLATACKDPARRELAVELAGSGMYRELNGGGRAVTRLSCRQAR
jgi:hypothetical protein